MSVILASNVEDAKCTPNLLEKVRNTDKKLYGNTLEVNFALVSDPEKQKKRMMKMITQIDARMKSRFMRGTYLPTLNIIASSKDSEQSFLEAYIKNKKDTESKNTLIVDEPQWVVDSRKDSPIKFYVAIGDKMLANELLPLNVTEALLDEYRNKGYTLWQVPIGYLDTFQLNLDEAICSIIGIATAATLKFISGPKLAAAKVKTYENPFINDILEVGTEDPYQYSNFFDMSKVDPADLERPMFVHLDMSSAKDKTGIAGVWITGKEPTARALTDEEAKSSGMELLNTQNDIEAASLSYKLAFSVSIKAPKGANISFTKNRVFINWLRDQGFNIKKVSADTYQSTGTLQELVSDGFETEVVTVDRLTALPNKKKVCLPYNYLRTTIYEKRIKIYEKCNLLTEELINLERESDGHINHPENGKYGCFTGDTKVSLVDGRELTFLELIDEFNNGKQNYVYSFNHTTKHIEPKLITNAWCTKKNAQLVEVELDNGEKLRCTPNHKFMLRDGSYCEAQYLTSGESLMPLYRKYPTDVVAMKNYRMYYEPIEDAWHYEHRQFAQDVLDEKYLVHHKDCNPNNNNPTNLVWCSKSKHQQLHKDISTGAHSEEANEKRKQSLKNWYNDENNNEIIERKRLKLHEAWLKQHNLTEQDYLDRQQIIEEQHKRGEELRLNAQINKDKKVRYIKEIEETFNVVWDNLSNNEKDSYAVKMQRIKHPETTKLIADKVSENHKLGKYANAKSALKNSNDESKYLKELIPTVDKDKFYEIFGINFDDLEPKYRPPYIVKYRRILSKEILNHKVRSVKFIGTREDVYDITVQDNHNFALSSGVFVHNSKDQSDALCGATWLASKYAPEFAKEYGETIATAVDITQDRSYETQLKDEFMKELAAISGGYVPLDGNRPIRTGNTDYDSQIDIADGLIWF